MLHPVPHTTAYSHEIESVGRAFGVRLSVSVLISCRKSERRRDALAESKAEDQFSRDGCVEGTYRRLSGGGATGNVNRGGRRRRS
jgi:hypothetical protein